MKDEYFDDWNQNGIRDSCLINLIYDQLTRIFMPCGKSLFLVAHNRKQDG